MCRKNFFGRSYEFGERSNKINLNRVHGRSQSEKTKNSIFLKITIIKRYTLWEELKLFESDKIIFLKLL